MSDFDAFWQAYPKKIGKLAAMTAYIKARRIASAEQILAGLETYKRHMPADDRFVVLPKNWLYDGRWMDEYTEPQPKPQMVPCDHTPRCNSKLWCSVLRQREEAS